MIIETVVGTGRDEATKKVDHGTNTSMKDNENAKHII